MNITIDTDRKTLLINGDTNAKELAMFICRNNFNEYKVVGNNVVKKSDYPDYTKDWIAVPLFCKRLGPVVPRQPNMTLTYWTI